MEDPEQVPEASHWTKEQFDTMARAFTAKRDVCCPICEGPIAISESPGPKKGTSYFTFDCRACRAVARAPFFRWDPNMFVHPPFHSCPKCDKQEFGVSDVHGDRYSRRCRGCGHVAWRQLPRPRKKIIYLDQHVISNMMLALNPAIEPSRAKRAAFGRPLFEVLDRAVKLQILICPDSHIHQRESEMSPHFKALERMYEQLSCGITFQDELDIESAQVQEHAVNWLRGGPRTPSRLTAQDLVHGDLYGWHGHLRIGVSYRPQQEIIDEIRARRERIFGGLTSAFQHWASISDATFETFRAEKVSSFGHSVRTGYKEYWRRRRAIEEGLVEFGEEDVDPPLSVRLVHEVALAFQHEGLSEDDAGAAVWRYFETGDHGSIPWIRLDALLSATLVWQFAHGRSRSLGRGTVNDLAVITHLLPYCDAMYLDNEMYGLLTESRVARELGHETRLFCNKTREQFVAYVESIIAGMSPEHMTRVREVYGEKCGAAFVAMYERD